MRPENIFVKGVDICNQRAHNLRTESQTGINMADELANESAVQNVLRKHGVFKGAHGLEGLLNAADFWNQQIYGTRLYYGPGSLDYLHIDVLRAAIEALRLSHGKEGSLK
jgi:hypothetical protein